jgi:HD-like signal output (HDOD) protein
MPFVLSSSSSLAVQLRMAQGSCLVVQEQVVDTQAACLIWSMADLIESSLEYVLGFLELAGHVVMLNVFPTKNEDIVLIRIGYSCKDMLGV